MCDPNIVSQVSTSRLGTLHHQSIPSFPERVEVRGPGPLLLSCKFDIMKTDLTPIRRQISGRLSSVLWAVGSLRNYWLPWRRYRLHPLRPPVSCHDSDDLYYNYLCQLNKMISQIWLGRGDEAHFMKRHKLLRTFQNCRTGALVEN
jgi:hypothetical protein